MQLASKMHAEVELMTTGRCRHMHSQVIACRIIFQTKAHAIASAAEPWLTCILLLRAGKQDVLDDKAQAFREAQMTSSFLRHGEGLGAL